jgi:hypothetical protein
MKNVQTILLQMEILPRAMKCHNVMLIGKRRGYSS